MAKVDTNNILERIEKGEQAESAVDFISQKIQTLNTSNSVSPFTESPRQVKPEQKNNNEDENQLLDTGKFPSVIGLIDDEIHILSEFEED